MAHNKKYQKSSSGIQCVGPCYKKNTKIIHPIYLSIVTDEHNDAFCPTAEWTNVDKSGKSKKLYVDKCNEPSKIGSDYITTHDLLYPYVNFDEYNFLEVFYNIHKFSDAIQWIEDNNFTPINSRQRIFDLAIDAYGGNIDIIETSDTRVVDFIHNLIKTKYINNIAIPLFRFISIKDKIVEMKKEKPTEDKETNETIVIKTNYIIKNIITIENLTNFLSSYFRSDYHANKLGSSSEQLINKFTSYIIGNIKKSFIK